MSKMFVQRFLSNNIFKHGVTENTIQHIQCSSITTRTHVKDYRPRPSNPLPKRPFIPPRKKDAYLTHPTPVVNPFETAFQPIKEFEPIQEFYKHTVEHADGDTADSDTTEEEEDERFRNVWPYKKWLWRSDKNFEGKGFDPKKTLEWFQDDENQMVGRAWYTPELRCKSNEDLMRLWYVLLREKNMLNSMRFACRAAKRQMPNWGRLKKVNKSMGRLHYVWTERSRLKLANLEAEQTKKRDKARNDAIEYRRAKLLEKREMVKGIFFQYVDKLSKEGKDVQHLFPKINVTRKRRNMMRKYIVDDALKPKPVLNTSEPTMIPADLLQVLQNGIARV